MEKEAEILKRKMYWALTIVLLSVFGCAKVPAEEAESADKPEVGMEPHVTMQLSENVMMDADVSYPEKEQYAVIHAKWDDSGNVEEVKAALFGEKESVAIEETDYSKEYLSGGQEFSLKYPDGDTPVEIATFYRIGRQITYDNLSRSNYFTAAMEGLNAEPQYQYPEAPENLEPEELGGYSREQAITDTGTVLKNLGFSVQAEPYALYTLSAKKQTELLEERYDGLDADTRRELLEQRGIDPENMEESNGVYCMLWYVEINGVPVVSGNYFNNGYFQFRSGENRGCCIFTAVNREGIQYMNSVGNQFLPLEKEIEEPVLPLEEILPVVSEYFANQTESERTIYRISFCYVPVMTGTEDTQHGRIGKFDMIPSWVLEVKWTEDDFNGMENYAAVYVDAITGELIR